jgi:hypothetical protein
LRRLICLLVMPVALVLGASVGPSTGNEPAGNASLGSLDGSAPIRATFYYPWFPQTWHDDDKFTPSRGAYSNDEPAVLDAQFDDMAYAGLDAAISSWWGPDTPTGRRLGPILTAAEANGVGVAPYYEKEYGDNDPSLDELRADLRHLGSLTSEPGWLRVDGRPVIFVYNAGATGCADVSRWKAATNGWSDFYVNMKLFSGFADCPDQPDSWHQYGPAHNRQVHLPWSFNVSPGFWHHQESTPRLTRDLDRFTADLDAQVASGARWQLVTSYSEWGEGTAVESAAEWESPSGRGDYLDAMREVYLGQAPQRDTAARSAVRATALADAFVNAARPRANYGRSRSLAVDRSPVKRAYLKFRVDARPDTAVLRLWSDAGSRNGVTVRSAGNAWREGTLTFRNTPDHGQVRGRTSRVVSGGWTTVDVTEAVRRTGSVSFVVTARRGTEATFRSSEAARRRPQLVLSGGSGGDSTGGTVVWAAGDACDDSDRVPGCAEVGRLIADDPATDYFVGLGDLQYENGELANFERYYDPKMGSGPGLKGRTWPVPGNHEYNTAGASGYFDYFGARAGDRSKGYYATDLGSWRLVVTNTNCSQAGGCSPSDPQGQWVQQQLAQAPACTIVAGHHPAITDGNYAPGVSSGKRMFDYAHDGGAELYLAGHDHEYQRFPALDKQLSRDPAGVVPMVVGTGGKNLTDFTSTNRSAYRQNTDMGALRLVLRRGSYDWRFVSVSGKVMDSGSRTCR